MNDTSSDRPRPAKVGETIPCACATCKDATEERCPNTLTWTGATNLCWSCRRGHCRLRYGR